MSEWVMITKGTNDPKLAWIETELESKGIPSRRNGESFHAPILEVQEGYYFRAMTIVCAVGGLPDDDPTFGEVREEAE